jgi:hypothetical protein
MLLLLLLCACLRSGFDHDKWARLRDEALARSYYDQRSIHRCVPSWGGGTAEYFVGVVAAGGGCI